MGIDDKDKWKTYRKFFVSLNTIINFDFSKDQDESKILGQDYIDQFGSALGFEEDILKQYKLTEILPFIFGRVVDFQPKVNELKVFEEENELFDEADQLNNAINNMRTHEFWDDPTIKPVIEFLFANTVPVAPYPEIESCLGLKNTDSLMTINDGFAVMSFNYNVEQAEKECLFDLKEYKEKKLWINLEI